MPDINVIIGPPCAGKSTHVLSSKAAGDVVVDADALAKAIGAPTSHARTGAHRSIVFKARQAIISSVLAGVDAAAWIIHTNPSKALIQRYHDAGAKFQVIDPGMDECLARCKSDDRPDGTEQVIRDWYDKPPSIQREKRNGAVWLY